ncbi:hypothetical protein [Sulfurovum sp.]|uniref:hypothetical protein n=1 Tax=Sulfurovum sp. TaxID=1969726 RepID=UPI0025D1DB60|nr:hypothetical protein [Sulfurovum sp.]
MNRIILISMVAASALFADMATDMVKDVAVSKAKTQAKEAVIKQVAGDDPVKQMVVKKVADKVVGEPSMADKVKGAVADKVMQGNAEGSSSVVDKVVKGATKTKEPSLKDKAVDMAAEKVVGSNPLKKEAAKEAIKSLAH